MALRDNDYILLTDFNNRFVSSYSEYIASNSSLTRYIMDDKDYRAVLRINQDASLLSFMNSLCSEKVTLTPSQACILSDIIPVYSSFDSSSFDISEGKTIALAAVANVGRLINEFADKYRTCVVGSMVFLGSYFNKTELNKIADFVSSFEKELNVSELAEEINRFLHCDMDSASNSLADYCRLILCSQALEFVNVHKDMLSDFTDKLYYECNRAIYSCVYSAALSYITESDLNIVPSETENIYRNFGMNPAVAYILGAAGARNALDERYTDSALYKICSYKNVLKDAGIYSVALSNMFKYGIPSDYGSIILSCLWYEDMYGTLTDKINEQTDKNNVEDIKKLLEECADCAKSFYHLIGRMNSYIMHIPDKEQRKELANNVTVAAKYHKQLQLQQKILECSLELLSSKDHSDMSFEDMSL